MTLIDPFIHCSTSCILSVSKLYTKHILIINYLLKLNYMNLIFFYIFNLVNTTSKTIRI